MSEMRESAASRLAGIKQRIAAAATAAGREPGAVDLVAIAKTHPADSVRALLDAGHRRFGENRVQEAEAKYPALKTDFPDLELHLVGPLQSNKARQAVALFDVIHTLDRDSLATALQAEMARAGRRPRCLVQVNTGEEPQKAGVLPADADAFIERCRGRFGLPVEGLMCIPPVDEDPALHFALLRTIAQRHGLPQLSMGMSGDFETAIRFGATLVRVGTALFGHR